MKPNKVSALTQMLRHEQTSVTEEHRPVFLGDNQAVCIFSKLTDVSNTSNSEGLVMLLAFDKYKTKPVKSVSRSERRCRQCIKWPKARAVLAWK